MLTHFEITRLISARALQIAMGAPILSKPEGAKTPYEIAELEFEEKKLPLVVIRTMPNGDEVQVNLEGEEIGEAEK